MNDLSKGIPDPYKKTVRLIVRIKDGRIIPFEEGRIPKIKDGTPVDLIVPFYALEDEDKGAFEIRIKKVLDKDTVLKCQLFHNQVLWVDIVLLEDLYIEYKGDDSPGKCRDCKCKFIDKTKQWVVCKSLNEAYSKASQIYEPTRRSHSGNIFFKISYQDKNGKFGLLNELRG